MSDLTRYEKQFRALMQVLDTLETRYQAGGPVTDMPRRDTVLQLVHGLQAFAQGQFSFFYNGFNGGKGDYPPLHAEESATGAVSFPPEHVLADTIAQISSDVTTIQLAAEQRILNYTLQLDPARKRRVGRTKVDLLQASDRLAALALWPPKKKAVGGKRKRVAGNLGGDPNVADDSDGDFQVKTVLTYLTDSVDIRVVPYAPVVLLGIPYTCLVDSRGFLAIPHEVGHFRYWYSFKQDKANLLALGPKWGKLENLWLNLRELFYPFEQNPKPTPRPTPTWSEEIFADTYGALTGGALSVLTAMDMAFDHSTQDLLTFDMKDVHPTPLIRPVLMIKALKAMNKTKLPDGTVLLNVDSALVESVTIQLYNRWKRMLEQKGILKYTDAAGKENDDSKDRSYGFTDPDVAKQVGRNMIAWDTRELDLQFPAEILVQKAIKALVYVFGGLESPVRDWGWTNPADATKANVNKLYEIAEDLIEDRILKAADVGDLKSVLGATLAPATDAPPKLWLDWVTANGKGYFAALPRGAIWAGKYDTVMDPTTRPSNTWLPVFGAGGWTTEGPCSMPPG